MSRFDAALAVADAVLYEGYLLYPYTASARKNRLRWQFGVVMPRAYAGAGTGETAEQQTEVLLEAPDEAEVEIVLRFLQVEARRVEALRGSGFVPVEALVIEGSPYLTFEEGIEREVATSFRVRAHAEHHVPIAFEAGESVEVLREAAGVVRGRIVRERWPLRASLTMTCEGVGDAYSKLRVSLSNDSEVVAGPAREGALRTALISTHTLLAVHEGRFLSVLDPPLTALEVSATLANRQTWPVLVGDAGEDVHHASLVLSSPIILYDFPAVAAQTQADACDATEIDELLTLSVLSLPQAERDEARATDPRARAIIERAERFGPEQIAGIHLGALHRAETAGTNATQILAPHDPFAAIDVPSVDCIFLNGKKVAKGSSVRLHPNRRADVWDAFLVDRVATVRAVHQDFEDQFYVAVTVDDDPASELHEWYGRSFFFSPDEVEPL